MKKLKKGMIINVCVEKAAFGGKGLARIDGMAVFVDRTVPGDVITARVVKVRKAYSEANLMTIDSPSPDRIPPSCQYAGLCGGCKWQDLNYERQLAYKTNFVKESVAHIGLIREVAVHPALGAENLYEYRNKMEFSCADRRWLKPEEMEQESAERDFALGLHVAGTFYKLLDIEQCRLMPALGNQILADIRRFMKASGLPAYNLRDHRGFWRFVVLRHSTAENNWMVNVVTADEDRTTLQSLADLLTERHPSIVSVVNGVSGRKASIAIGETMTLLAGKPVLIEHIGALKFEISANSFFQTNTRGAAALYRTVKQYAGLTGGETVLDLYCGAGTIALCLADAAKAVIGVEVVESAVADALRNKEINAVENCSFMAGDIKDVLPRLPRPDVVVLDPPRAGMHPDVVHTLLKMLPDRIVYVSCNPATLARDLGMMKAHYVPDEIQPVDLFPHTWHIESVARLRRV